MEMNHRNQMKIFLQSIFKIPRTVGISPGAAFQALQNLLPASGRISIL
jgi:hypothetical protein